MKQVQSGTQETERLTWRRTSSYS